jgi:phosphatidylinositol transfer protein SFH5
VSLVGDDERTDMIPLKFLRAHRNKVKEAMAMLRSVVLWCKRFGNHEL